MALEPLMDKDIDSDCSYSTKPTETDKTVPTCQWHQTQWKPSQCQWCTAVPWGVCFICKCVWIDVLCSSANNLKQNRNLVLSGYSVRADYNKMLL